MHQKEPPAATVLHYSRRNSSAAANRASASFCCAKSDSRFENLTFLFVLFSLLLRWGDFLFKAFFVWFCRVKHQMSWLDRLFHFFPNLQLMRYPTGGKVSFINFEWMRSDFFLHSAGLRHPRVLRRLLSNGSLIVCHRNSDKVFHSLRRPFFFNPVIKDSGTCVASPVVCSLSRSYMGLELDQHHILPFYNFVFCSFQSVIIKDVFFLPAGVKHVK